jgi:hypothetical protein
MSKRTASLQPTRVMLIGLFSPSYPMPCESYGLSVIAGGLEASFAGQFDCFDVIDMYAMDCDHDLRELVARVEECRPNVIGISVPYGSYSYLREAYPVLSSSFAPQHRVAFGGAIATYNPDALLRSIDPRAVVVIGEGDEAFVALVRAWLSDTTLEHVPNLCYLGDHGMHCTARSLVDLTTTHRPYRGHISRLHRHGAQLFVEASRGCRWSRCTICPRGLSDCVGEPNEYRVRPNEAIKADIAAILSHGATSITFSDEDFLAGTPFECKSLVEALEESMTAHTCPVTYDASMSVYSVFRAAWSAEESRDRASLLRRLKACGLRKVFLGVESGAPTQLRRYRKGHTVEEAAEAIGLLEQLDLSLEIGFIMFDPLCTIEEIIGNICFLRNHGLAKYVSSLGSAMDLRLQKGSHYMDLLARTERDYHVCLHSEDFDSDKLTHLPSYLHDEVSVIVNTMSLLQEQMRPLYYPLKSITRYGEEGCVAVIVQELRAVVVNLREMYLDWIEMCVQYAQNGSGDTRQLLQQCRLGLVAAARSVLVAFRKISVPEKTNIVIRGIIEYASSLAAVECA